MHKTTAQEIEKSNLTKTSNCLKVLRPFGAESKIQDALKSASLHLGSSLKKFERVSKTSEAFLEYAAPLFDSEQMTCAAQFAPV